MKRFHVHIAVESIDSSVNFYNTLFGQPPSVLKTDYAKWMLEDPKVNFAISQRPSHADATGLDHLGFQLESTEALHSMTAQLAAAQLSVTGQGETTCCYAQSDKGWVHDPQGIAWESFVTFGPSTTYGTENATLHSAASGVELDKRPSALIGSVAKASCGSGSSVAGSTASCC